MTSGRPSARDAPYITRAPTNEPAVPAITTPTMLISPCAAQYAAGGITSSLGTGNTDDSIAMRRKTPR